MKLVLITLLGISFAQAQRGRLRADNSCPQMVACLAEFSRQMAQCESNARSNPRLSQVALSECGADPAALRQEKRSVQATRQMMMSNCTRAVQPDTSTQFCSGTRSWAQTAAGQGCFRLARRCRQECLQYKLGCLEAAICHENYETGAVHDRIHGLNKRLLETQLCLRDKAQAQGGVRNLVQSHFRYQPNDFGPVSNDMPGHEELFED